MIRNDGKTTKKQKNNEEDESISPWLMRLLNKAYIHRRAPIPVQKVSKAIRKKKL